jgi:hypothetical protein
MFILEQGLRWDVIKSVLTDHPLVFTLSGAIHNLTLTFSDISGKQAPAAPPVFDFLETDACPRITEFMVWQ